MHYGNIKNTDIANGIGVRVTLFVSGCNRHCKNCFNKETWDFNFGKEFTTETQDMIIEMLKPSYITGLTLLGGEPLEKENQKGILPLIKKVRTIYGNSKTIWCYTGYTYEKDLVPGGIIYSDTTKEILDNIDVLVDGPFIDEKKNISLKFRGSENQRIIDVKKTLKEKCVVLYME